MSDRIRRRIHEITEATSPEDPATRIFGLLLMALIVLNVAAVMLETVAPLYSSYGPLFRAFEVVSVSIFTVEYGLRLWSCTADPRYRAPISGRLRYALTPMALVDLLAIAPFYLPAVIPVDARFLRLLRLFRFARLLKMARYTESLKVMGRVLRAKKADLAVTAFIALILLLLASALMYFVEHEAQPENFASIPDALWWGIITLTTIGYGDVFPITAVGRLLGGLIAVLGIGLIALPTGIIASGFSEAMQKDDREPLICPHCGRDVNEPPTATVI